MCVGVRACAHTSWQLSGCPRLEHRRPHHTTHVWAACSEMTHNLYIALFPVEVREAEECLQQGGWDGIGGDGGEAIGGEGPLSFSSTLLSLDVCLNRMWENTFLPNYTVDDP